MGTSMSWPPRVTSSDDEVPRELRSWRFTADGPFWGAVLCLLIWFSVCGYIVVLVVLEKRTP